MRCFPVLPGLAAQVLAAVALACWRVGASPFVPAPTPPPPLPPRLQRSLLGLLIAPLCIARFGWPSVFYLFGGFGLLWCAWWEKLVGDVAAAEPELAAALTGAIVPQGQQGEGGRQQGGTPRLGGAPAAAEGDAALVGHGGHGGVIDARAPVPWRAFLRNPALGALAYTHYCNNWFHYTMLAWMPTYFTDSLALDLGRAAQVGPRSLAWVGSGR